MRRIVESVEITVMLLSKIPESMDSRGETVFWDSIMTNFVVEWCCCFSRWKEIWKVDNKKLLSFFASNSATFGMRLFILNYTIVVKKNEVLLYKIYERPALYISSVWNIWRTWRIDELNYDVNIQQLTTRKKNGALPRLTIVCWFQNICVIVTDRIKSSHIFKIRLFKGSGKTQLIWDS